MAVFAHLEHRFELSRIQRTMHIQRDRQDPEKQTATVQCALKHSYTKQYQWDKAKKLYARTTVQLDMYT